MSLRRFLSRRWLLGYLVAAAVLFGLTMSHPYPRQSLFGPKIRGKPWCVWENEFRRNVHAIPLTETLVDKALGWVGFEREPFDFMEFCDHPDMLPLFVHLADDNDLQVRDHAVAAIHHFESLHHPSVVPLLRRRLDDERPSTRINAAGALWAMTKDQTVVPILVGFVKAIPKDESMDRQRSRDCNHALHELAGIAEEVPEVFAAIAGCSTDPNSGIRGTVMHCMPPVWQEGIAPSDPGTRRQGSIRPSTSGRVSWEYGGRRAESRVRTAEGTDRQRRRSAPSRGQGAQIDQSVANVRITTMPVASAGIGTHLAPQFQEPGKRWRSNVAIR